jgi:hypothetical protein
MKGETSARVVVRDKNNDADFQLFYGLSDNDFECRS